MTNIQEKIDKHLNERKNANNPSNEFDDVGDSVKGIKKWLDDFEKAYGYGNFSQAGKTLNNIVKKVKDMQRFV